MKAYSHNPSLSAVDKKKPAARYWPVFHTLWLWRYSRLNARVATASWKISPSRSLPIWNVLASR